MTPTPRSRQLPCPRSLHAHSDPSPSFVFFVSIMFPIVASLSIGLVLEGSRCCLLIPRCSQVVHQIYSTCA